ncbi:MAG: LysR substrate-binding domain-containing protein [Methyloligellaceae bacterium]
MFSVKLIDRRSLSACRLTRKYHRRIYHGKLDFSHTSFIESMFHKWLQAFHYVVKLRSFTEAAKHLHVGQPTISTHVGNLEKYFGAQLLHRSKRRIQLTPEGENLFRITSDIFGYEQEAIDYLRSLKSMDAGELKFCAVRPYDVMELLDALRKKRRGIKYSVRLQSSENVIDDLIQFRSDIGIVSREFSDPEIHSVFYRQHKVFVVVNKSHRLAKKSHIQLADLDGEEMIVRTARSTTQAAFNQAAAKAGITINPVFEMESREGVREAIIRDMGIGVISETVYAPHKDIRPLVVDDADIFTRAYIVCLASRIERPLIKDFLGLAQKLIEDRKD